MLLRKHLIILSVLCSTIQTWPIVRINFSTITHDLLLAHYGDMNTSLSTTGGISAYFHFDIDVNLFVKFVINFDSDNLRVNFMDKTVSWCKVMQAPRYEPLIKIAYKAFSRKSHLPQKCPIEKNHLFYIKNFIFETKELPPVLPTETNITFIVEYFDTIKDNLLKVATMKLIGQTKHY